MQQEKALYIKTLIYKILQKQSKQKLMQCPKQFAGSKKNQYLCGTIFEINTTEIFYWFQNEKNDHH